MDEYKKTGVLLKILSFSLLIIGIYDYQPLYIPFVISYFLASRNPWRYRIIINTGLILHFVVLIDTIFKYSLFYTSIPYTGPSYTHVFYIVNLIFNLLAFLLLAKYYPSPYPLWMNLTAFLFSTESNVEWIEKHPKFFNLLARKSIIGTILGLYYNSQSFNIIQEEGFLGFSPVKDILKLAKKAGVKDWTKLLEIGSGLGGPICAIAGEYRLRATGLDLLRHNTENAKALASRRNLSESVSFIQGNGMFLPFKDNSFDFVFGSDAWCHVPNRNKLVVEINRVLRKDGKVFFYDWLDTGGVSDGFRFIYAFPPLETMNGYKEKLNSAGFEIISAEYDTEHYINLVENVKGSVIKNKRRIIEECGRELYDNWLIVVNYTLKMLYEKKLGHGLFIARKI